MMHILSSRYNSLRKLLIHIQPFIQQVYSFIQDGDVYSLSLSLIHFWPVERKSILLRYTQDYMWLYAVIIFYFYFLQICGTLYTGLIYSSLVLQFQVLCISDKVCSCFKKALLYTTLKAFSFCLFFHLGQWSPPGGGVSHQKETGLSFKGVSDRRQGRHWQLQHQSFAPSHTPGSSEESAAGKAPRRCVGMSMEESYTC